jgi:hypothetical protein
LEQMCDNLLCRELQLFCPVMPLLRALESCCIWRRARYVI